ncbi:hypothetical protein EDB86DRAFT_3241268 [Lactarius hatsudake]|nr:hypothetical protein EDB86DRAFT_2892221 [Lactarius hatsudake]KAH9003435.1 hypothetical protein EDB86DRAFT_3241268 [Lactarius hatsudake]
MSANSEVWTMAGNVATAQNLIGITLAKVAAKAIMGRFPSAEALLDACSKDLNGVKERFNEITKTIAGDPSRGELIRAAVERQQCESLETLEFSLRSLLDEHNDLSLRSQKSSLWGRNSPFSKLREEISELKEATGSLLSDTRVCTGSWNSSVRLFTGLYRTRHRPGWLLKVDQTLQDQTPRRYPRQDPRHLALTRVRLQKRVSSPTSILWVLWIPCVMPLIISRQWIRAQSSLYE